MPQEQMQHEARQPYTYYDEWNRPWAAIVDTRCRPHLAPCTPLQPQGWSAPILPPFDLIMPDPKKLGRLIIAKQTWLIRAVEAEQRYLTRLRMIAEKLFGDEAQARIDMRDPRIIGEIGKPPESSKFVRAVIQGEPWVLGLVPHTEVPSWALKVMHTLPDTRSAAGDLLEDGEEFLSLAEERRRAALAQSSIEGSTDAGTAPGAFAAAGVSSLEDEGDPLLSMFGGAAAAAASAPASDQGTG